MTLTRLGRIFLTAAAALITVTAHALCISPVKPPETLTYKVMFKWGLINKNAGSATLRLQSAPHGELKAVLTASSAPWADRIYKLRDTLVSYIDPATMQPRLYERIAHEDGKYSHDIVTFERHGNSVTGHAVKQRRKKSNQPMSVRETDLLSTGATVDMISAFYYLRSLDFNTLTPGSETEVWIFSGSKKERLRFKYIGKEQLKINDSLRPSYHVSFTFTTEGSKKSSDDIDTWLSEEKPHVPLKLQGSLPVGKIQCFLEQSGD